MEHHLPPITRDRPARVYIAGPFRGPTLSAIDQNVSRAKALRAPIAMLGCFPVCVHAMEGTSLHDVQQDNGGQFWLDGTMGELESCHAVVLVPGWEGSAGTRGEVLRAWALGLPIFTVGSPFLCDTPALWYEVTSATTDPSGSGFVHVRVSPKLNFATWAHDVRGTVTP